MAAGRTSGLFTISPESIGQYPNQVHHVAVFVYLGHQPDGIAVESVIVYDAGPIESVRIDHLAFSIFYTGLLHFLEKFIGDQTLADHGRMHTVEAE